MKIYKLMFTFMMILGSIMAISSYSWLGMWMGLEINLISIIPLFYMNKNMYSSEASIKYFLTQALASMLILFSIILLSLNSEFIKQDFNLMHLMIMNSGLLTKMGAAPFHFWFPEIMEGLSWLNCLIILTWQKIAPMILLMYNSIFDKFFFFIIVMSLIIGSLIGLNQTSLRKILTFSSINHIGWMISALIQSKIIWLIYFSIYSMITVNLIFIFNKLKMFMMTQLISSMNNNIYMKLFFSMNLLSLGGLPPFIGFIPKWFVINEMCLNNQFLLSLLLILFTLITLFFYLRMIISNMITNFNSPYFYWNQFNWFPLISFNSAMIISFIAFPLFFNYL
uniref:NADH-ubiquinone oxidoreductase chain 2 n=1 Tax=Cleridae sp. 2 ACP-2013 TaxID=1434447 RepID=A0A3G3FX94_9CUCU|nr:NADH dehydrogenase subunit 2 [Cleridae sp. 2 ACP-2013]